MGKLLDRLPIGINLWKWAAGDEYTVEDDTFELPPELAKSDEETNKKYDDRYGQKEEKSKSKGSKVADKRTEKSDFKKRNEVASKDKVKSKEAESTVSKKQDGQEISKDDKEIAD